MDERAAQRWFDQRLPMWRDTESDLGQIEDGKSAATAAVLRTVRAYPEIARDLAVARRIAPSGRLTRHLEQIYANLHRTLLRRPENVGHAVADLVRDVPRHIAALRWHIAATTALFIATCAAGWSMVVTYPELISLFASEAMVEHVQRGELWTDNLLNVFPSSLLAVRIFTNNIVVSLTAMCAGVVYGLGTIYIIALNGLMLGAVFAFAGQHGLASGLFSFVCAHGFVELSAICISGAVGISLGEALARPGHMTRTEAFQAAVRDGGKVMLVCIAFLVGAGLIEGYVSPNPSFSVPERLAIGVAYLLLFAWTLLGGARRWRVVEKEDTRRQRHASDAALNS